MTQISLSRASLRIVGDELLPDEITELLGCRPTRQQTKGEEIVVSKTGHTQIALSGAWCLQAEKREPEDLDDQVCELLDKLSNDLAVWKEVSRRFDIDLFVGLFMNNVNEGSEVSSETLRKLGERGIALGLDVYCNARSSSLPDD